MDSPRLTLRSDDLIGVVLPAEGAVLSSLTWRGVSLLARTPWAESPRDIGRAATSEDEWVSRWRGGWQLCTPSTGQPSAAAPWFHGEASLTPWQVTELGPTRVRLAWHSADSAIVIDRSWELIDGCAVEATTTVTNGGAASRPVQLAEHLILGSAFVTSALESGEGVSLTLPPATFSALDYAGLPTTATPHRDETWQHLTRDTPAVVSALVDPQVCSVSAHSPELTATITWSGLDHALLWAELGASVDPPWNGEVMALGIEPTTTPHGAGIGGGGGIDLGPGQTLSTTTRLLCTPAEGRP